MSELTLTAEHFPSLVRLLSPDDLDRRQEEFERLGLAPLCQVERDLALPTRYADAWPEGAEEEVTQQEAQAALEDARNVVADIRRRIA
jgi:HEPN domain-containing protein